MTDAGHLAFVALGANLADPLAQVRAASDALGDLPRSQVVRLSSLYRTEPVGIRGQPDFINAVAALHTGLEADELLDALFALERRFGRLREFRHAPRTLDLDLLLYDQLVVDSRRLSLPHPRMHLRAFVLAPLVEIAGDCRIPGRGLASAWLTAVSRQRVDRIAGEHPARGESISAPPRGAAALSTGRGGATSNPDRHTAGRGR